MHSREELAKQIGQKLLQAREEAKLSRADVGERLGLTERGYGHIEAGRSLITLDYLVQLPRIFSRPITDFLPEGVVTDAELANPLLDPLLREIIELWSLFDDNQRAVIHQTVVALADIIRSRRSPSF